MHGIVIAGLIISCVLALAAAKAPFDWAVGNSSVWLNAAAYCDTQTYLTRTYKGYTTGFQAAYVIDGPEDVQVITRK